MSDKKLSVLTTLLLFGLVAVFFPSTALNNSSAFGQEFYPEYQEDKYYNQE